MFIWACGPIENLPHDEMLMGQVNITMNELTVQGDRVYCVGQYKVILSNIDVGEVNIKIMYKEKA